MKYTINVKTGVRRPESVVRHKDGTLVVTTRSKPIDGEANKSIISLLSEYFNIPKTKINIISGNKFKIKVVEVVE